MGFGSTILLLSQVTAQQESRLQAARRYSEAGQISQTSMPQRDIVQTLSTGECFHSSLMRKLPFHNLDYIFLPGIKKEIEDAKTEFEAYVVKDGELKPFTLKMGELTDDEREIILKGCLINYNRK